MERAYSIDYLKFFAILSVVFIHAFPKDDNLGVILNVISRIGVPVFFASAGYLMYFKINTVDKPSSYFKKYLIKLGKIYFAWIVFYTVYEICFFIIFSDNLQQDFVGILEKLTLIKLFYYGASKGYHLWFLPALFWSTVIVFCFFRIGKLNMLLIISLFLNLLGLFSQSYSKFFNLQIETRDMIFFGLFYTTMGFVFASNAEKIKAKTASLQEKLYLIILFFIALQVGEYYWLQMHEVRFIGGNYYFSTIPAVISIFIWAINNISYGRKTIISNIGNNSFGIYVVHVFVIYIQNILISYSGLSHLNTSIYWNIFNIGLIMTISYFTYRCIQYIKLKMNTMTNKMIGRTITS